MLLLVLLAPAVWAGAGPEVPRSIVYVTDRHGGTAPRLNTELYLMNVDGSGQRRLTRTAGQDEQPAWAPGGRTIAFVRNRAADSAIYTINTDGTGTRRLSPSSEHYDSGPSWSPDGKRIAFARGVAGGGGQAHLWIMRSDGSRAQQLTRGTGTELAPSWSPDGRRLAFWGEIRGNTDIFVVQANGSDRRRLTSGRANDLAPAWSPDGKTIAFNSDRDGGMQLYLINPDGTNLRPVGFHPSCNEFPSWSPDGRQLAFTSNRDAGGAANCAGPWEVYVTDLSDHVTRLTRNNAFDWTAAGSWRPSRR